MKHDNIKGKNKERRERRKKVSVSICHLLRPDPSRQKNNPTDYIAAKFDNNWS